MDHTDRRTFLGSAAALAATGLAPLEAAAPSETVNVAVLGCGRGAHLARSFARIKESQVVAICDVDESRGQAMCNQIQQLSGRRPEYVVDFRTLLDRKDVDALAVATPDHWHAPVTIHACLAGKDVYVEKPASHNIHEGRTAVTAARKHKRIVQHGTNLRAAPHYKQAWKLIADGAIGKVMMVKAINNQRRARMAHRKDEAVPKGVNYDIWVGPAPMKPFNRNRFHTGWHWLWDYGTGDLGNDGVHQVDIGRWALNLGAPKAVSCSGAKLGWKGDAHEVPDAMVVTWEYDDLLYVFEQRDFTPYRMQAHMNDNDNIIYGDDGYMMVDRDGYRIFHRGANPARSSTRNGPTTAATIATSLPACGIASKKNSMPTSSKDTTRQCSATSATSPTGPASGWNLTRRPRLSPTTNRPTSTSAASTARVTNCPRSRHRREH